MTKKQPFQCRLLECHATEQFDNNTQQAKTCKNVDFCQGFP